MAIYDFHQRMHWRDQEERPVRALNRKSRPELEEEAIRKHYSDGFTLYWTSTRRPITLEDAIRYASDSEQEEYERPVPLSPVWKAYPSHNGNEFFGDAFVVVQWLGTTPTTAIAKLSGRQLVYICGDGEEELRIYEETMKKHRIKRKKTDRA